MVASGQLGLQLGPWLHLVPCPDSVNLLAPHWALGTLKIKPGRSVFPTVVSWRRTEWRLCIGLKHKDPTQCWDPVHHWGPIQCWGATQCWGPNHLLPFNRTLVPGPFSSLLLPGSYEESSCALPHTPCHNTGLCSRPQSNRAKRPQLTARISPTHLQVDHLRRAQLTEGGATTGQEVVKGVRKQSWGAASKQNSSMVSVSVAALVSLSDRLWRKWKPFLSKLLLSWYLCQQQS